MPYYAAMAALGSLAGCIWLYLIARKGGEAYFHHRHGVRAMHAKRWGQTRAFLSVFVRGYCRHFRSRCLCLRRECFRFRSRRLWCRCC